MFPLFYSLLFLYIEPLSTLAPAVLVFVTPGAAWWHAEIPAVAAPPAQLDPRSQSTIWHLANCYFLISIIEFLVLRAIRDALPHNPAAQTRILRAYLTCLAIADVSHVALSLRALPPALLRTPLAWNSMTHGNISFTTFLFLARVAWLSGAGHNSHTVAAPTSHAKTP